MSHLYGEANTVADALSRLAAPGDDKKAFPAAALAQASEAVVLAVEALFTLKD